jgi:hypothetical protein
LPEVRAQEGYLIKCGHRELLSTWRMIAPEQAWPSRWRAKGLPFRWLEGLSLTCTRDGFSLCFDALVPFSFTVQRT